MTRCLALVALLLAIAPAYSRPDEQWVGSWAAAQLAAQEKDALPPASFAGATLRQIVHLSAGGAGIRVRVSNAFGREPLHLLAVHVAHAPSPSSSRIDVGSDRAVTFNEREDVLIPAGGEYVSDPLSYPVAAMSDLAITMKIEATPDAQTAHPGSRATSYLAKGASVSAAELQGQSFDHWYFLSGVDVSGSPDARAIVTLGDSITDGHGATTNGNDRWPDILSARLQKAAPAKAPAVLNVGIGGNRVLEDGTGPNVLARFDRDVLARDGVRYLIVLEGINDIGSLTRTSLATGAQHDDLVRRMIGAYRQLILRAHAHGIKVIGATVLPFMGSGFYHPGPANESDRQKVNAWIRAAGHFDAVVDFDRVTADAAHPEGMRAEYDCGDHLHPSPAGYRAMADAVALELFRN
jgi:lysophospholipase L1-like esterase